MIMQRLFFSILSIPYFLKTEFQGCSPSIFFLLFISLNFVKAEEIPVKHFNKILLSQKDKLWMKPFIEKFFLQEPVVYTLFGSKPMSSFTICTATEKEFVDSCQTLFKSYTEDRKKTALQKIQDYYQNYDSNVFFQKWLSWKKDYTHPLFLFRIDFSVNEKLLNVDLINVRETLWILQKNYSLFSRETGIIYNPFEVVFDFENDKSEFWKKVLHNHILLGVLYGFGERNSYFFSLMMKDPFNEKVEIPGHPLFVSHQIPRKNLDDEDVLNNIDIPPFRSFTLLGEVDPIVSQFEQELEFIKKKLKGKNYLEEVLKQMFSVDEIIFINEP